MSPLGMIEVPQRLDCTPAEREVLGVPMGVAGNGGPEVEGGGREHTFVEVGFEFGLGCAELQESYAVVFI